MRGLIDRKGEQFGYFIGSRLYTLDDEMTGSIEGEFIVDITGQRIWRVVGDAVYSLDSSETIGFIGSELADEESLR
jgi:hypothetical protein